MHKESYYTPESIEATAREFLAALDLRRAQRDARPILEQSALLVLDMQDYFLDANSHAFVPSAAAITPGIQSLVQAYSAQRRPVVFTRHTNTLQNAGQMAHWWRDLISPESALSEISAALERSNGHTIEKTQYDAFYDTPLQETLEGNGVTQVTITGVMTHLCCETTARSAFMRGFEVFFCVDGTATYNRSYHQATLLNLAHGFATPILVDEVLQAMRARAS